MKAEEYIPFGPEWKREVMRLTKAQIVEILRDTLMKQSDEADEPRRHAGRHRIAKWEGVAP